MAKLGGMEEVLHVRETRIQELTKRLEDREHVSGLPARLSFDDVR